jgi:glutamine amidotransferase
MRVLVIATGVGNVRSVVRALDRVVSGTKDIVTTADPDLIRSADVLVVPGQGSFGAFSSSLCGGLDAALVEHIRAGTPYLGICLGLQILFEESDEAPGARGLGIFRGRVRRLESRIDPTTARPFPLPHVGWNRAEPVLPVSATTVALADHYYFAHSYAAAPEDASLTTTTTDYGDTFTSAVQRDNVVGVQFHPEKSQRAGLGLLARFFSVVVEGHSKAATA